MIASAFVVPATGVAHGPKPETGRSLPQEAVPKTSHAMTSLKVANVAVSQITQTSARITSVITPPDEATTWWFEYGQSPSETQSTVPVEVTPSGAVVAKSELTDLAVATTYNVRLVAESGTLRVESPWVVFSTRAPAPPAETAPAPAPKLAKRIAVAPKGTVAVRRPGSDDFHQLGAAASIAVGSVVDARQGAITLDAAQESGPPQRASFGGGRFLVRQRPDADGYVDLYLRGRELERCSPRGHVRVLASAARKRPTRKLWGSDRHGRFRTHGRDSVATVRGTRWTMTDRCGGTLTRVSEGAVDVKVRRTGRVVRVHAGETQFARHRG